MTSNFCSAGTDLDSLFYIDNGNAGALNLKINNSTDLGNRYTAASTLGRAVGFQYQGTDIGYLRGQAVASAPTDMDVAYSNTYSKVYGTVETDGSDNDVYESTRGDFYFSGYWIVSCGCSCAGTMTLSYALLDAADYSKYIKGYYMNFVRIGTDYWHNCVDESAIPYKIGKINSKLLTEISGWDGMTKGSPSISSRYTICSGIAVNSSTSLGFSRYFTLYLYEKRNLYQPTDYGDSDSEIISTIATDAHASLGVRFFFTFTSSAGSAESYKDYWIINNA